MLPAFLFAMYEKDGLPLEKVLKNMITVKFIRPPYASTRWKICTRKNIPWSERRKGERRVLKRKNDRQPPQSLDELYPDDYWLDEEDGEEELPDPAMKRRPVSGRLHDEPMVTGYEALERQRGVRRPNRKLTRREKKALKRAQKYEEKLHKEHEKRIRKMQKGKQSWQPEQKSRAVRDAKKNAKKEKEQTCRSTVGAASGRKSGSGTKGSGDRKENTG